MNIPLVRPTMTLSLARSVRRSYVMPSPVQGVMDWLIGEVERLRVHPACPTCGVNLPAPSHAHHRDCPGNGASLASVPDDIRHRGWAVAAHNDYRLNGASYTFWLFTMDDRAVKGEGKTDAEALGAVREELGRKGWYERD